MRRILFGSFVATAMLAATLTAAPKPTVPATIALTVPATLLTAFQAGTWPALGDQVTFAVSYPKIVGNNGARIQVMCYQGDALVYGEAGPFNQAFLLGGAGSIWLYTSQGPAHCVADLYYWSYQGSQKFNWLATTEFDAAGAQ